MEQEWYASWFDNPYYHLLYKNRDQDEAERFIQRLVETIELPENGNILDLACGKGRHSKSLRKLGFNVLGTDLSPNSIAFAQNMATSGLQFIVHDMREPIEHRQFDAVFNLFTSFGYFHQKEDNQRVVDAVYSMLNNKGLFIIDFMNSYKVKKNLIEEEVKEIDNVRFEIKRSYDDLFIFKTIQLDDNGHKEEHTECVQSLELNDFNELLDQGGFEILRTFGDFNLNDYQKEISDRLIIVARKK